MILLFPLSSYVGTFPLNRMRRVQIWLIQVSFYYLVLSSLYCTWYARYYTNLSMITQLISLSHVWADRRQPRRDFHPGWHIQLTVWSSMRTALGNGPISTLPPPGLVQGYGRVLLQQTIWLEWNCESGAASRWWCHSSCLLLCVPGTETSIIH